MTPSPNNTVPAQKLPFLISMSSRISPSALSEYASLRLANATELERDSIGRRVKGYRVTGNLPVAVPKGALGNARVIFLWVSRQQQLNKQWEGVRIHRPCGGKNLNSV